MSPIDIADEKIKELLKDGSLSTTGEQFAIYPFGMEGKAVKSLLEVQHGISPALLLDNFLSKRYPGKIHRLEILKKPEYRDVTVLIASDRGDLYDVLRDPLYKVHPKEKCVELFPQEDRATIKRQQAAMKRVREVHGFDHGMVFSPKHTKAKFFLPLATYDVIQQIILLTDDYFEKWLLQKVFVEFEGGRIGRSVQGHSVLDLGANIGNHSLYFAMEADARNVFSFEPVPFTFDILKKNIAINGLEDRVELHNCGIGAQESRAVAGHSWPRNIGSTELDLADDGDIVVKPLDAFDLPSDISLIKVDVEGMEEEVIYGAEKILSEQHPDIMMEIHPENREKMWALMDSIGYQRTHMAGDEYLFT